MWDITRIDLRGFGGSDLAASGPLSHVDDMIAMMDQTGLGSRRRGGKAFELIESAQTQWRCINAPHLVPLVRARATFINGKLLERPTDQDQHQGGQQAA
jgi:hypothetical protein